MIKTPPKEREVIKDYAILRMTEYDLKQQQKQDERIAREIYTRETYLKRTGQQWAINLVPRDPSEMLLQETTNLVQAGVSGFVHGVWDGVISLAENAGVDLEYYKYKKNLTNKDLEKIKETKPEYHAVLVQDLNDTPELRAEQERQIRKERKRVFKQALADKEDTMYNTLKKLTMRQVSTIRNWFDEMRNPTTDFNERMAEYEKMTNEMSEIYMKMAVQHMPAYDGTEYVKRLDQPTSSTKVRQFQDMVRETAEQVYEEKLANPTLEQTSMSKSNVHSVYDHLKRGAGGAQTQTMVHNKPSGVSKSKYVRLTDRSTDARAAGRANAFGRAQRRSSTGNIHLSGSRRVPGNRNSKKSFPGQGFSLK